MQKFKHSYKLMYNYYFNTLLHVKVAINSKQNISMIGI